MTLPQAYAVAWERWQRAAGRWRLWGLCLPLVAAENQFPHAPKLTPTAELAFLGQVYAATETDSPTLLVLDVAPEDGVVVAGRLARAGRAVPVLFLGRWPYAEAVLPVDQLLDVLVREAPSISPIESPHIVLVLDGERDRPIPGRAWDDPRADNRWLMPPDTLPSRVALERAGIRRVLLVQADQLRRPDELEVLLEDCRAAGWPVDIFPL